VRRGINCAEIAKKMKEKTILNLKGELSNLHDEYIKCLISRDEFERKEHEVISLAKDQRALAKQKIACAEANRAEMDARLAQSMPTMRRVAADGKWEDTDPGFSIHDYQGQRANA
jgi:hypothetical protein